MAANVISDSMVAKYLTELQADENKIGDAGEAYESAKALLDVTLRRYMALRDYIAEQLGRSPYAKGVRWPDDLYWDKRGRYRFTGMKVGEAAEQVIRESESAVSLDDIVQALSEGGLGFPEPIQARAVNAALMKLPAGIKRGSWTSGPREGETCYWAEASTEDEEDDLPFE